MLLPDVRLVLLPGEDGHELLGLAGRAIALLATDLELATQAVAASDVIIIRVLPAVVNVLIAIEAVSLENTMLVKKTL